MDVYLNILSAKKKQFQQVRFGRVRKTGLEIKIIYASLNRPFHFSYKSAGFPLGLALKTLVFNNKYCILFLRNNGQPIPLQPKIPGYCIPADSRTFQIPIIW